MIKYINNGDLFCSTADALVNPVNCKGAMGKGIAKEFKKRFPECMQPYKAACASGKLVPGKIMRCHLEVQLDFFNNNSPNVLLFPTKEHWKKKSRIEWIDQGLYYLKEHYKEWNLKSIAMPQLGCGLGGLRWEDVKPLLEKYFANEPVEVEVYISAVSQYKEKPSKSVQTRIFDKEYSNSCAIASVLPNNRCSLNEENPEH
jgi:O-acetyl-ADP-ribose deacetylase (regulator of RNase III)